LAHIINLAAQDALHNLKVGYAESEDEILDQIEINGVIPKVRNCILFIFKINLINTFFYIFI
jgi:hypothetical protein